MPPLPSLSSDIVPTADQHNDNVEEHERNKADSDIVEKPGWFDNVN